MTEQQASDSKQTPKGAGSFCMPRAVAKALLDNNATAYEICAYLTLARFTEATGQYSSASITAVNKATGANKTKGGAIDRALQRLKTMQATHTTKVSNGKSGKSHGYVDHVENLGAILYDRETWVNSTGEVLPDGAVERAEILHILPDFGEALADRIWFGNGLVTGTGGFKQPLKALKNAGDVAARLLLVMYGANDMETWGGVRPVSGHNEPTSVYAMYNPVTDDVNFKCGVRLVRSKSIGRMGGAYSISNGVADDYWQALTALESNGLIYEVVMVLNKAGIKGKFEEGGEYLTIPSDAEPLYELDARSKHGYKPAGEEGIGSATARTAGDCGEPVATLGGVLDGTYAAFVPRGNPAMIAGIYRLRFRVANPKNAGVKNAWGRIRQNNIDAFELVAATREAQGLPPIDPPWVIRQQAEEHGKVPSYLVFK
jgi:hypothetical protein